MSTPLTDSAFDAPTRVHRKVSLPGWAREPLLHFVLLGALLFTLDHFIAARAGDPHTIVVGTDVDNEAKQVFHGNRGRDPDAKELTALREVWLDNEVLYREGLAMQVDRGDKGMRERVIFKALMVVDASVRLPSIDDAQLRTWFESHRSKYDEPARYSFEEAVLSGDTSESAVRSFVAELNTGTPGDARAGLQVFKERPYANLVQSYGAEFPDALAAMSAGEWRAVHTRDGWRAMRLDAITPPQPAVYEVMRNVVLQDWKDATASEQRTAAVRKLARKYKVVYAGDAK